MTSQALLDFTPPVQRPLPPLEQAFRDWINSEDGQAVYLEVLRRALTLRQQGWKHYGIGALWESVRYDHAVKVGPDAEGYKVNDHHRSRLARLLMERNQELVGRLRSDPNEED